MFNRQVIHIDRLYACVIRYICIQLSVPLYIPFQNLCEKSTLMYFDLFNPIRTILSLD